LGRILELSLPQGKKKSWGEDENDDEDDLFEGNRGVISPLILNPSP
jgi:hypothetical protein